MNSGLETLDRLTFARGPMSVVEPFPPAAPNISVALPIAGTTHTRHLASPFFVQGIGPAELGTAWEGFCSLLRRFGIAIYCQNADLEDLPVTALPFRLGRRFANEQLDSVELRSADALQLEMRPRPPDSSPASTHAADTPDAAIDCWGWTSEAPLPKLPGFLAAIRQAAENDTPIGLGLPMNIHPKDLQSCLAADADFLAVSCGNVALGTADLVQLVQLRNLCSDASTTHRLPLLVTTACDQASQIFKLLALGASAVCIDPLVRPLLPPAVSQNPQSSSDSSTGSGMLRGISLITPQKQLKALLEIERRLQRLQHELWECLRVVGISSLIQLDRACLRNASDSQLDLSGLGSGA